MEQVSSVKLCRWCNSPVKFECSHHFCKRLRIQSFCCMNCKINYYNIKIRVEQMVINE